MILLAEIKTSDGETLGIITLPSKQFKTGSRGYYGNGKVAMGDLRYQVQVQMVEIGSKVAPALPEPDKSQKKARRGAK